MAHQKRKYPRKEDLADMIEQVLWRDGAMTISDLTDGVSQEAGMDIPRKYLTKAIHYHRNEISTESSALVVAPVSGTHWFYTMTDDPEVIREWVNMRSRDTETRLATILAQAEVAVRVTDGRSIEGKRARLERKLIGRLIEDIEELVPH